MPGIVHLPQRFLGWLFDRIYVDAGRYACYNQQRYLDAHNSATARSTSFDWTLYQVMLSDRNRLAPYRRDIAATVPGRTVLEIGPGPTAVLTLMAARAGAQSIVSVEGNGWVEREAARHLRRAGFPDDRVHTVAAFSDDLTEAETRGRRHFDVLLLECYHAIASQERVVETIANLRASGFSFDQVISRGFTTYVAPAAAPTASAMPAVERAVMGWPVSREAADAAMASRASSLHGDMRRVAGLRLAEGAVWQHCDFERDEPAWTAGELRFRTETPQRYAGLLFWNKFHFHTEDLDTGETPTDWGAYFVPLPLPPGGLDPAGGATELILRTRLADPATPSAVSLQIATDRAAADWSEL